MQEIEKLLTSVLSKENINTIIIGVIAILLPKSTKSIYQLITNFLYSRTNFTISGTWLAVFPSHVQGKDNFEFVRIKQDQEKIKLSIFQYTNVSPDMKKFEGNGVYRGGQISAVYYPKDKLNNQTGVFALKVTNLPLGEVVLSGKYAEFGDVTQPENIVVSKEAYVLRRIKLPFFKSIRLKLGRSVFDGYHQVKKEHLNYYCQ